jgi:apolipoprotein N-acyltransferase
VSAATSRLGWGAAAALVSAALLWGGTGLHPAWWLTWLAPWPVLAFAVRAPGRAAAAVAFAAWAGGGLNLWSYYRTTLGVPLPVVLVAMALPAIAFAAVVALTSALARRGRFLAATLALPAGWTAFEHLLSRVSLHGTFGSLAYTQMDCLPVIQVAAVVGISGITFLLVLVPSAMTTITLPTAGKDRARVAWVTSALVALALGYGGWRLLRDENARPLVMVGLAAADRPEQPVAAETDEGRALVDRYAQAAEALGARGARVVVLPETVVKVTAVGADAVARRFAGLTSAGASVVLGADRTAEGREVNAAVALSPGPARVYAKQHLLQPFESRYQPGSEIVLLDAPSGRLGLAVCKDMDFPDLGRRYAERGASILLVPAWDFTADGWLHSRMAVLRGVEGGFAVVRAARGGRLTVSDDRGRVIAEAASADAEVASLLAAVHPGAGGTIGARLGGGFGWASCGVLAWILALALALAPSRRARSGA